MSGNNKESVAVRFPDTILEIIDELKDHGLYGNTRSEVIRNLLVIHLSDCLDLAKMHFKGEIVNPKGVKHE